MRTRQARDPRTPAYYLARLRKIARGRGGVVLARAYVDDTTKLRFRCAEGHEWAQAPGSVKSGRWCTECAIARRAATRKAPAIVRLHRQVARRGGVVLSPVYVNSQTKLRYRCIDGHEWSAAPARIIQGQWCPVCADVDRMKHHAKRKQRVVLRLQRIVNRRGGTIFPPGFVDSKTKLRYRCARGHTWEALAASIEQDVWCPRCNEESLLAVLRARAERWGGACISRSCRSGRDRLDWRCALGHRFQARGNEIKRGMWCSRCRQPGRGDIERMRQVARERGGECLSERYVDAFTKLRWRCRDGHEWNADAGMTVRGHWCPECGRRDGNSRARLNIEIMRQMAAERGGACLSATYQGSHARLRWRCARGHAWLAHVNRVRQGSWCPVCCHSARGTIDGMRALAIERGGRCLTRTWNNHRQPLQFECGRGHRFHIIGGAVKTGVWCPTCRRRASPPSAARLRSDS